MSASNGDGLKVVDRRLYNADGITNRLRSRSAMGYNRGVGCSNTRRKPNRIGGPTMTPQPSVAQRFCTDLNCKIPHGFCHCGCGRKTNFRQGKPNKWIMGHQRLAERDTIIDIASIEAENHCKVILLTKGQFALVDTEDYDRINASHWCAQWHPRQRRFYAVRKGIASNGKSSMIQMHREIMGLKHEDKREIDHKEPQNTLDNRKSNLRICTSSQNKANSKIRTDNRSGMKGVRFHRRLKRWTAEIKINGKSKRLGWYATAEQAAEAYKNSAVELFGEFARFK